MGQCKASSYTLSYGLETSVYSPLSIARTLSILVVDDEIMQVLVYNTYSITHHAVTLKECGCSETSL